MPATKRRRVIVDDSALAQRIGARIKAARLRAGLTQQQLADGRYTKAYVSALENGLAKPSMAALNFLASRLDLPASSFLGDESRAWTRLEADLLLAAGQWQDAGDAYAALLEGVSEAGQRAESLRGQAEAWARLDDGASSAAAAAEAAETFRRLGREADASLAEYWLSFGEYLQGNAAEAIALLVAILARLRAGLVVEPDFSLRVLMALATNESHRGNHAAALGYLEEVRAMAGTLDDRRRATFLYGLAAAYRETGDFEAAIRTGLGSLALFRSAESEREIATLENDLALSYLAVGNLARAEELAASSRARFERTDDRLQLAHVTDTEGQIALARKEPARAAELAARAYELARAASNPKAAISALITKARAEVALGQRTEALATYEQAAAAARDRSRPARLREVLAEWADLLAELGDHARAYEVSREALQTS